MKMRTKIICLALAAFCAFSGSAQAADQWYKSTTQTGTYTTMPVANSLAITGTSGKSLLKVPGAGFTIECSADSFTGSLQNVTVSGVVEPRITISGLTLTGCQLENQLPTKCDVHSKGQAASSGIITAVGLTGSTNTLTGAKKAHALFAPTTGTVLAEIEILGGECPVEQLKAVAVTGAAEGSVSPEGEVPSQTETFTFPTTALGGSTLKYGTDAAAFVSTETATITSGDWVKLHL